MDQPAIYGPIAHTLSFAKAARLGIICNYKVIISIVTSEMVNPELLSRGEVIVEGDVVRARTVANQIAIQKACEAHDLKKIFSFHRSVESARDFTGDGASSIRSHLPDFKAFHVNGEMRTASRERLMRMGGFQTCNWVPATARGKGMGGQGILRPLDDFKIVENSRPDPDPHGTSYSY
jgi:hypothetical protein